jgi:hypothetical protein
VLEANGGGDELLGDNVMDQNDNDLDGRLSRIEARLDALERGGADVEEEDELQLGAGSQQSGRDAWKNSGSTRQPGKAQESRRGHRGSLTEARGRSAAWARRILGPQRTLPSWV